jgi:hypothetical protein
MRVGYVEAAFAIGEKLAVLFQPRFVALWKRVGVPPGPWRTGAPLELNPAGGPDLASSSGH